MRGDSPLRVTLVAVIAGLFGWIVGLVFPLIGPDFAAIVAALAAFGAEVAHRLAERGMSSPSLRLTELGVAFLVAKIVHLALLGPEIMDELATFPTGIADTETTLGFLLMWFVRSSSYRTIRDVRLLGSPGDESVGTAYDRLARRFRLLLGTATFLSAFALTGWQQLAILDRPAVDGLVWPLALILIIGVASLGAFRRLEDSGRWRRAGARVDEQVWLRWGAGVVAVTVVAGLTVLLFRVGVDEFSRTPAAVVRGAAWAGSALLDALGVGDPDPVDLGDGPLIQENSSDSTSDEGVFDFLLPDQEATDPSGWQLAVVALAWFAAGVGIIAIVMAVLRNRRWIRSAFQIGPAEGMKALFIEFLRMLAELARLAWAILTFWRPRAGDSGQDESAESSDAPERARTDLAWEASDPRRSRIAAAYHRFLVAAGRLLPRHRAETPDEYGRAMGSQIPFGRRQADRLTGLFVEARYSSHPMSDADGADAEQLADELLHIVDQQADGR